MPTSPTLSTSKVTSNDNKGRKATDLFRAAYDKAGLSEERAQRLNENPKFPALLLQLIEEESADQVIRETKVLKPDGSITFPERNTPIDPSEFFNRSSVYLWGSFRERILPVLKPVASTPKRTYGIGRLKKNAYDREIRPDLPKRHLGNWKDIASLIDMYPNGKEGYYLLYLEGVGGEVFAVRVYWGSVYRQWRVNGWKLGEYGRWFAGAQVLCPSNAAL
ncbi:MAG: hypothetical protein WBP40_03850 [Candidatus Moraniibacteriota bacterium]